MKSPLDILLPYQRKWVDDDARFKLGIWSRQTGKDFSTGAEMVRDCMQRAGITWLLGAPSERQSLESLAKCKEWAQAFELALDLEDVRRDGPEALMKSTTIQFANKSRIIAVPGRPETVRGFSANITFTEAAFFDDIKATWRAVLPSITNPLRGGIKRVRLITTPNGQGDLIHQLFVNNFESPDAGRKQRWAVHRVTIHDAVAAGLDVDVDELREAMDDPEGFAVEFECEFLDLNNVLLPYDVIALGESAEATAQAPDGFWDAGAQSAPVVLGIDFGRTTDPTVCWADELVGGVAWTREVLVLRGMSSDRQEEILAPRIARAARVCFDYTGPGIGLGDYLVKKFGRWKPEEHEFGKIELCQFTAAFKREEYPKLRRAFEAPTMVRIPISREIREDLHEMRAISRAGNFSYESPRTAAGHSDRCTAKMLANRARRTASGPFAYTPVNASKAMRGAEGDEGEPRGGRLGRMLGKLIGKGAV